MSVGSILIIEDEPAIADTLVYAFKTEGFSTDWCQTGGEALALISTKAFDLVVLDIGLPDVSGFDVCRSIRSKSEVPVLFLTSRNSEIDRIVGLELGADDYVTKPFSPREVTARVRAILRRTANHGRIEPADEAVATQTQLAAGITIDMERCEARLGNEALDLTRYEFRILGALISKPGRVFSRDQLMEAAWDDPGSSLDRTVDAHIKTLRAKLRSAAGKEDFDPIRTHRGFGYSFSGDDDSG